MSYSSAVNGHQTFDLRLTRKIYQVIFDSTIRYGWPSILNIVLIKIYFSYVLRVLHSFLSHIKRLNTNPIPPAEMMSGGIHSLPYIYV